MEIFNQDLKNIKAKLSQTTKVPQSTNPKSNNIIEGPASKKYHYNKDYLKALSREDLEQIVLSQGHHTSLSSLSSLYSLPSQAHSRNSVIENGFDPAVSSSQKVETLAKPNNAEQDAPVQSGSSYPLYNPIKSKDPSHSKSVSASGGVSFDANIPAIKVNVEKSAATKELSAPKKSSNASSAVLGYSLGDLGVQPQTLLQHPGLDLDVNKKPGSKHGSISGEKENYQATSRVEHVPSELLSYTGVNKDLINSVLPLQNSGHIVVKNIRSEANSAAFAGAMKALQEKVRKLEAENDHLKKSLESKDYYYEHEQWSNTGNMIQGTEEDLARVIEELKTQNDWLVRENQQMHEQIIKDDGKDGIEGQIGKMNDVINQLKGGNENVKKSARYNNTNQSEGGVNVELELAQRKIYELELIKTELYNSKLELEARLNQVICSVENNERVFQDKITELEAHLKDATVQNELHSKEISILNSHLGREKINLSEALEEIRAAYKDKIEQCTANIEALRSDRKSLRKIAKAQNEENKTLQKKVKSLEKIVMASESLYNKDTSKEGILDHLRQINNTLLSKARDTTNSSIPTIENSYGEDKGRKSHGLSFSELTTKSALKSSARSSRSKSPNKEKNLLSASYTHRPCRNKENEYDLSFSYRVASSPLGKNSSAKKSRKSSAKKKSKKSRTPERKSSRETKDNSLLTSRTQGLLMSSRNLSPNQTRHTLTGYSILADGNSKKKTPTKISNGGYSPRFSNEPSLVKAQLFYPRSVSTERGERTQRSIAKLETEIDALKKDHKNMLSSSLQPMKISTKSESLKRIIGMIEDKSNSLAVLKSLQKKSSGKKK